MSKGRILIVDDEANVTQAVTCRLCDEGFDVACATSGGNALRHVRTAPPDVVLLELWLPDQDGVAVLQAIKQHRPELDVIVMSGHGDIATAVQVTKLGAFDYLEKPCSPDQVVTTVQRALRQHPLTPATWSPVSLEPRPQAATATNGWHTRAAVSVVDAGDASHTLQQRTLGHSVVIRGQGLQSGLKTGMLLSPLPPGRGIIFRNIATGDTMPASIDLVASTAFCTSLRQGNVVANTIEHLLSVLHAYHITNLLITITDEVPIMDGSALPFCQRIEAAGMVEQDAVAECLAIDRCYHVGEVSSETKFIVAEPCHGFRVTYRVRYPAPIGVQEWTYEHHSGAGYRGAIAPARTFGFVKDVEAMHEAGLLPGGRLNNVILVDDTQIVNTAPLRFANEFVRHKILDLMGDLYLLGMPIRGHVCANMTGHTEHVELVRALHQARGSV